MRLKFPGLSPCEQPLFYLALAFICGEIAVHVGILNGQFRLACFSLTGVFGALLLRRHSIQISSLVVLITFFSVGAQLFATDAAGVSASRVRRLLEAGRIDPEEPIEIRGYLDAAPELAPNRIYLDLNLEEVQISSRTMPATGIVHLVIPFAELQDRKDYDSLGLDYGIRIRALASLRKAQGFRNPGSPDFDDLLEFRGYDGVGSIKSPLLIERLGTAVSNHYLTLLNDIRGRAIATILRLFSQPASGILAAALFGNGHFLSKETAENFRIGGTYHLLVISGSHVAMLALIANWLLKLILHSRFLRFSISVSLLWSYAFMIGAQPAITRATVMLTFLLFGQLIFRNTSGLNILGASAIALLAWHPRDLYNPSFQLSFLTAFMIIAIAGPLLDRLKRAGQWEPTSLAPYPPRLPAPIQSLVEILFWNERLFQEEQKVSSIRWKLVKSPLAVKISSTRTRRFFQQVFTWCVATVTATAIVQAGLLPVMIAYFHRASPASPVTNVIQGALISGLMVTGLTVLLIAAASNFAALVLVPVVNATGWLTVHGTDWIVSSTLANARVPDYGRTSGYIYATFFVFLVLLIVALGNWNPLSLKPLFHASAPRRLIMRSLVVFISTSLCSLIILLVWHPHRHEYEAGRLAVTFIDVGQGDSILIRFPQGKVMLLDAGGQIPVEASDVDDGFVEDRISVGEVAVSPPLWRLGIKRLDLIAASHAHSDHVQGFDDIGRNFSIREALAGVIPAGDKQFEPFRNASRGVAMRALRRGDEIGIDGVRIRVLAPFISVEEEKLSTNNQSLVVSLKYGDRVFLLTGDMEKEIEGRLIAEKEDVKCDVLKVAHHGSRSSSTPEMLRAANPEIAVISVAYPSPFNHPHPETIAGLEAIGAKILRTSRCGAITISTDGKDLKSETYVKCE